MAIVSRAPCGVIETIVIWRLWLACRSRLGGIELHHQRETLAAMYPLAARRAPRWRNRYVKAGNVMCPEGDEARHRQK